MAKHIHFHFHDSALAGRLDAIDKNTTALLTQGKKIMVTLADVVAAEGAEDAKVEALVQAFKDLAAAVEASKNDPVVLQGLVDRAKAEADAIDAALNPPTPTPTV